MQSNFTIYICDCCHIIVSTSLHVVREMKDVGMIIFQEANANKTKTLQTSLNSFDKFCTYQSLACIGCSEIIGRFYRAVTPQLSNCCEHYFIMKEKLARFEKVEEGKASQKSTPTFTHCLREDLRDEKLEAIEKDIQNFDPLALMELSDPYDEYKFIKRTIKIAEQAESTFTAGLLKLESRMDKVEKTANRVRHLYKHIINSLELL